MKQLLVVFLLLCSTSVFAQDVIVKKDGSTVVCRVVELTSVEIVYKKWSEQNGSNYIMNRSDASSINYQNGKKVNLSEDGTNLYAPGNQNNGEQQYNDIALLQLDYANKYKRVKTLRNTAWIGGAIGALGGIITLVAGKGVSETNIIGAGLGAGAVAWTTTFLLIANRQKKIIDNRLQPTTLWQKEINLKNGATLIPEVDIIKDNINQKQALGLGFHYNF